jgi:hypothetical protein
MREGLVVAGGRSASRRARILRADAAHTHDHSRRRVCETDASAWAAGARGEQRVAAELAVLTAGNNRFRVLHDRLLSPDASRANLDHVVVCDAGIFLIDSKNWAGEVLVVRHSLVRHRFAIDGSLCRVVVNDQIAGVGRMANAMAQRAGEAVIPVLCLTGSASDTFDVPASVRGVHVVAVQHLVSWLSDRNVAAQVESRAERLAALFPDADAHALRAPASRATGPGLDDATRSAEQGVVWLLVHAPHLLAAEECDPDFFADPTYRRAVRSMRAGEPPPRGVVAALEASGLSRPYAGAGRRLVDDLLLFVEECALSRAIEVQRTQLQNLVPEDPECAVLMRDLLRAERAREQVRERRSGLVSRSTPVPIGRYGRRQAQRASVERRSTIHDWTELRAGPL